MPIQAVAAAGVGWFEGKIEGVNKVGADGR